MRLVLVQDVIEVQHPSRYFIDAPDIITHKGRRLFSV